ncbi:MAG: hypothetical protein OXG37_08795 [Actinomycetia bacterium]|nr:hypothetical protein [Actinomycetes bacterium]
MCGTFWKVEDARRGYKAICRVTPHEADCLIGRNPDPSYPSIELPIEFEFGLGGPSGGSAGSAPLGTGLCDPG